MKEIVNLFKHRHIFQDRAINTFGIPTYRVCLKCRKSYQRINKPHEIDKWEQCEPLEKFDSQFDKKDNYIFKNK
jgi:hypothetical protein